MGPSSKYNILLTLTVAAYYIISKTIFDKVDKTTKIVVDELYHIPQGLSFCSGNFTYNPKITTFPGLYIVSASLAFLFNQCNAYGLRFVNLLASCVNLVLFSCLPNFINGYQNKNLIKNLLQAINLAILPPLYFFSHVYYTETLSLMFLLLFFVVCFKNDSKWLIAFFGSLSLMTRQTNVIWVAMEFGNKAFSIIVRSSRVFGNSFLSNTNPSNQQYGEIDTSKLKRYYGLQDLMIALNYHISTNMFNISAFYTVEDAYAMIQQVSMIFSFMIYALRTGSIVVGDKQAHYITLNFPQMLYFLLFYGVFGLPFVLVKFKSTIKLLLDKKYQFLFLAFNLVLVVRFNTIVHPYLLADNRHYTFYIWNRWFGKYDYAIYATIPLYIFLIASLYDNLKDQNCISFLASYWPCAFLVLVLQGLVEVRYFLIPYIILRLRFETPSFATVLFEFLWYLVLNMVTFYIFFTKEVIWSDFNDIQRIIW